MDIYNQLADVKHHVGLFYKTFDVFILFSSVLEGFIFDDRRGILLGSVTAFSILLNLFLKQVFKLVIKDSGLRPVGAKDCDYKCKSYGMPSGHSQTFALITTLIGLSLIDKNKNKKDNWLTIKILCLVTLLFGAMYSRVSLKCHTWIQCIVGTFIGVMIAYFTSRLQF